MPTLLNLTIFDPFTLVLPSALQTLSPATSGRVSTDPELIDGED